MNFDDFWKLVEHRGRVACFYRAESEDLWRSFTPQQQKAIYDAVAQKIASGRFVSYRPTDAIRDNAPKTQIISGDEYYRRFNTQTEQDGWRRVFLPEQQKTIYVKQ